ncbi:hypothetical protein KJ761_01530 [Patescibacteria group bacterium]|nr:hypothetical protein [Patescibacteria group bacterium]
MSGGLSFCQDANQSLQVLGTVIGKRQKYDVEFDEAVAYLQNYGLLGKDVDFANRMELGEFLIDKKSKFKMGAIVLNKKQIAVLDQALDDILGRRIYS